MTLLQAEVGKLEAATASAVTGCMAARAEAELLLGQVRGCERDLTAWRVACTAVAWLGSAKTRCCTLHGPNDAALTSCCTLSAPAQVATLKSQLTDVGAARDRLDEQVGRGCVSDISPGCAVQAVQSRLL